VTCVPRGLRRPPVARVCSLRALSLLRGCPTLRARNDKFLSVARLGVRGSKRYLRNSGVGVTPCVLPGGGKRVGRAVRGNRVSRAGARRRKRAASWEQWGRAGGGAAVHVVGGPVENVRKGCQRRCRTRARRGCAGQEAGLGCRARSVACGADKKGEQRAVYPPQAPPRHSLQLVEYLAYLAVVTWNTFLPPPAFAPRCSSTCVLVVDVMHHLPVRGG
jgi:hypothetical protein